MQRLNLSFLVWYKAIFQRTASKKVFSSEEILKQLDLKRSELLWAIVHKMCKATGNQDGRHLLDCMIEVDEGYFTVGSSKIKNLKGKPGRGAAWKSNMTVMAESVQLEYFETGIRQASVGTLKPQYCYCISLMKSTIM